MTNLTCHAYIELSIVFFIENLCTINKCSYHAECKAVNRMISQCVCPHLGDCPKNPSFVCGSDKITYRNICTLKAIACRLKLDIEVSAAGFCSKLSLALIK